MEDTEVTKAVNQIIVTVTGIGKMKNLLIKTAGPYLGQEIVMTKWAGLEGTAGWPSMEADLLADIQQNL